MLQRLCDSSWRWGQSLGPLRGRNYVLKDNGEECEEEERMTERRGD